MMPSNQTDGSDELNRAVAFALKAANITHLVSTSEVRLLRVELDRYCQAREQAARLDQCKRLRRLRDETGEEYYTLLISEEVRLQRLTHPDKAAQVQEEKGES